MGDHQDTATCVHDWCGVGSFGATCIKCHITKARWEALKYRPHSLETLAPIVGHVKHDQAKTRYDLIPVEPLREIADVLTSGATKYTPNNWAKGCDWSRYYSAMRRHCEDWWGGEDADPETKRSHLAHAACCLLFLMAYQDEGLGNDDRRQRGKS